MDARSWQGNIDEGGYLFEEITSAHPVQTEDDNYAKAFMRCFETTDGQQVLEYLVKYTQCDSLPPSISDQALRHMAGQRSLVHHMVLMMEKGRAPEKTPSPRNFIAKMILKIKGLAPHD